MTHPAAVAGATLAASHADAVTAGWSDRAMEYLKMYSRAQGSEPFMAEDVRLSAEKGAFVPSPPDGRAWGAVILRAKRLGLIKHAGYAPNKDPGCHGSPKSVWRVA